jgi:hypothetical protein
VASGGDVNYEYRRGELLNLKTDEVADVDPVKGWVLAGTMHSHPGEAFWSAGDDRNELPMNGFHITVGCLSQPNPHLACSIVVRFQRFVLQTEAVFDYGADSWYVPCSGVMKNVMERGRSMGIVAPEGDFREWREDERPGSPWLPKGNRSPEAFGRSILARRSGLAPELIPDSLLEANRGRNLEEVSRRANALDPVGFDEIPEDGLDERNPAHRKIIEYMADCGFEYDPEENKFVSIGS